MFRHNEVIYANWEQIGRTEKGGGSRGEVKHLTLLNIKYQGHYLQPSALID